MRITVAYKKVVVGRSLVCQDVVRMPVAFTSDDTINSLTVLILRSEKKQQNAFCCFPRPSCSKHR